ncbi:MAG: FAD:protein FMN transferase [Propionicimonas sp.]|uniref:FAD:protein FMN transferase n=1 Tax=Propionicimonas sp. TaxID=1955623 RepID=UPI003D0B4F20
MVAAANWDAFGTWFEVLTVHEDDLPDVADEARARVRELEAACSPTRTDTELAALVPGRPQKLSPLLARVLAASLRTAELTDGLVGPSPEWRDVDLDADAPTVVIPEGVRLDLGTGVRAWAADWIADACETELGIGCLVNLGGDIAVRGDVPDGGWQVEIDDHQPSAAGRPVIAMGWPGGLSTATSAAGTWRMATVAGRTCERANAAARAAIALGDSAPRWLTQRELPARLVHTGGVVVQTNGWPRHRGSA